MEVRTLLLPALFALGLGAAAVSSPKRRAPERGSPEARRYQVASHRPGSSATEIEQMLRRGVRSDPGAPRRRPSTGDAGLRRRLAAISISEDDARAFFEANRDVFGHRSFEASRRTIERLLALQTPARFSALGSRSVVASETGRPRGRPRAAGGSGHRSRGCARGSCTSSSRRMATVDAYCVQGGHRAGLQAIIGALRFRQQLDRCSC